MNGCRQRLREVLLVGVLVGICGAAVSFSEDLGEEEVQTDIPVFYLNPSMEGNVLLQDQFDNETTSGVPMNCDDRQCVSQISLTNGEIFQYRLNVTLAQHQLEVELQLSVLEGNAEMYVQHSQVGVIKGIPYEDGQLLVINKGSLVQGIWYVVVEAWGKEPINADLIIQSSFQERDINETDLKVLQNLKNACCASYSDEQPGCQEEKFQALNDFHLQLGAGWCQKPGQLCDRSGNVVKLNLSLDALPFSQSARDNCSLAPHIRQLPQFTSLVLDDDTQSLRLTDILGPIEEFKDLSNLRYLSLNKVKLLSTLPRYFCGLESLEYLSLAGTGLKCFLDCFAGDSKLHYLDLSSNYLGEDCSFKFGWYPGLRHLDLSQNHNFWNNGNLMVEEQLQDGVEVHNLDYVKYLNLSNCNLLSFDALVQAGNLSALRALDVSNNEILGNLKGFFYRDQLEYLDLSGNQIGGSIPNNFGRLQRLWHLDLSNNKLIGGLSTSIAALSRLQYLNLEHNQLSGEVSGNFSSKNALQELRLGFNNFTGTISKELFSFKNLRLLELQHNQLQGTLNLAQLGWLDSESLADTQLPHTDIGLGEGGDTLEPSPPPFLPISQRRSLARFNASFNQLTAFVDSGVPQNMGLFQSKMQFLDLSNNHIGGTLPQILLGFKELEQLDLSGNALGGPLAWFFSQMGHNNLRVLNLAGNRLSGTIPSEVTQMRAFDRYQGGQLMLQSNNLKGYLSKELVERGIYSEPKDYWPNYMLWTNISDNFKLSCQPGLAELETMDYGINQFTCIPDFEDSPDIRNEVPLIDYLILRNAENAGSKYNTQNLDCVNEHGQAVKQKPSTVFKDGYNCSARVLQYPDTPTLFVLRVEDVTRPVQLQLDQQLQMLIRYLGVDVQRPVLKDVKGPFVNEQKFVKFELKDEFISRPGWWMLLVRKQLGLKFRFLINIASVPAGEQKSKKDVGDVANVPVSRVDKSPPKRDQQQLPEDTKQKDEGTSKFQMSLELIIAIILIILVLFLIGCVSYICRRMFMNRARLFLDRNAAQQAAVLDQNQIQLVQEINRMHGQRLLDRLPTFLFLRDNDENERLNNTEGDETCETASSTGCGNCVICLEAFRDQNEVMTLPCCHQFHAECIGPWVRCKGKFADCPICKAKIYELLIAQQSNSTPTPQTPTPPPDPEEV